MKSQRTDKDAPVAHIDINKLSYRHRFAASGLLTSKANGIADSAMVSEAQKKKGRTYVEGEKAGELVDVGSVMAAIAYYDMALLLMRPFDHNYLTVANWKCNQLCKLRQYEDAATWYAEIIRLDEEAHGGAPSADATAALARKQLASLQGKKNAPLSYRETDTNDFVDPPFTGYALQCVTQLAKGKYADATLHFEANDRKKFSSSMLKKNWKQLVGNVEFADLSISLESHLFEWEGKSEEDVGWCYFSISGPEMSEGIACVVKGIGGRGLAVRHIEFGRP